MGFSGEIRSFSGEVCHQCFGCFGGSQSSGVDIAVQYGLDTSFGFIQTVCAIIGAVSVTGAAKRALFRGIKKETHGKSIYVDP